MVTGVRHIPRRRRVHTVRAGRHRVCGQGGVQKSPATPTRSAGTRRRAAAGVHRTVGPPEGCRSHHGRQALAHGSGCAARDVGQRARGLGAVAAKHGE